MGHRNLLSTSFVRMYCKNCEMFIEKDVSFLKEVYDRYYFLTLSGPCLLAELFSNRLTFLIDLNRFYLHIKFYQNQGIHTKIIEGDVMYPLPPAVRGIKQPRPDRDNDS